MEKAIDCKDLQKLIDECARSQELMEAVILRKMREIINLSDIDCNMLREAQMKIKMVLQELRLLAEKK